MTDVRTAPYAAEEKRGYRTAKRVFDILLSFPLGILSLIPMGILAAVIVCKDGGNPFYGQSRVGQNGQEFRLIKLRSMKKVADRLGDVLDERQLKEDQKEYKLDDDPRLIGWKKPGDGSRCFGAKLRRSSMDELPQILFNVFLTGKMSMVGPRPERPEIFEKYEESVPDFDFRLKVKAGFTGYAQVYGKYNTTPYDKLKLDMLYIENYSFWLDIKILLMTFKVILQKENSEGIDENQITALKREIESKTTTKY